MTPGRAFRIQALDLFEEGMKISGQLFRSYQDFAFSYDSLYHIREAQRPPLQATDGFWQLDPAEIHETRSFLTRALISCAIRIVGTAPIETWLGDEIVRVRIWDKRLWGKGISFRGEFLEMLDWLIAVRHSQLERSRNPKSFLGAAWDFLARWVSPESPSEFFLGVLATEGALKRILGSERKIKIPAPWAVLLSSRFFGDGIASVFAGPLLEERHLPVFLILRRILGGLLFWRFRGWQTSSRKPSVAEDLTRALQIARERDRMDGSAFIFKTILHFQRDLPGLERILEIHRSDRGERGDFMDHVGRILQVGRDIVEEANRISRAPYFDRSGPERVLLRTVDRARSAGDIDLMDKLRREYLRVIE